MIPETSRTTAIELLAEILSYRDRLVKTESIRNISFNTFIESELEERFLGALKLYRSDPREKRGYRNQFWKTEHVSFLISKKISKSEKPPA
jgi:hypothetical protein